MENLFNYITYLTKYFNLLIETEEARKLMNQEVGNYQRNRWLGLINECGKVYDNLFLTFDKYLIELCNEVTIEIFRRDTKGQKLLYAQLLDIMNEFANKFNKRYIEDSFSEELTGVKFAKVNVERADGTREEKSIKCDFSIAMLADDLSDKFNQLQTVISERFKFLKPVDPPFINSNNDADESLQNQEPKTFEFPPIPDGILKQPGIEVLLKIEKSLIEKNFCIDVTGRWYGYLHDLADLLWAFKVKGYFKSKNNNKFTKEEKQFFKIRYNNQRQLDQYLYPSKRVEFHNNQFKVYWEN